MERNVATGLFTFDVTDSHDMNVDLSYGKVETTNINGALDDRPHTIIADNAFRRG